MAALCCLSVERFDSSVLKSLPNLKTSYEDLTRYAAFNTFVLHAIVLHAIVVWGILDEPLLLQ
eukprot:scaffold138684_cov24-Tisochrysis_lutea.AAC.2